MADSPPFGGSIVALVTPMNADGSLDLDSFGRLVDWHLEQGTQGLVPMGTTGESCTLAEDEHLAVIEYCVKRCAGRIPVIAGAGSNATAEAIARTRAAERLGIDASLQVVPYYNRPGQEGLYRHFAAIAECAAKPMILYNVPSRTAVDMQVQTVARLAALGPVAGIKEAGGDPARAAELRRLCGDGFALLSGDDQSALAFMRAGGDGVISVTANLAPAAMRSVCGGDAAAAAAVDRRLQALHSALFWESSPAPVKWCLAQLGRIADAMVRLPLVPMQGRHSEMRQLLAGAGLL